MSDTSYVLAWLLRIGSNGHVISGSENGERYGNIAYRM